MIRDPNRLSHDVFDVLVIGAGIYGAFVSLDAASRGLSVALIDRGDFGNATSENSLKIIHGGLRYLQDGNFRLARQMASERKAWLKIAPHLVHPMPFLIPTTQKLTMNKSMFRVGLGINDLISFDRNRSIDSQKHIPGSRILSKEEFLRKVPLYEMKDLTGGAMWYDAQMYSSERLLLSVVLSAAQQGSLVANYVKATGFLYNHNEIKGVTAKDALTGQEFDIRARCVVNATGPWLNSLVSTLHDSKIGLDFQPSIAMNLVTRQILDGMALGVPSRYSITTENGSQELHPRIFFIVPWQGYSIIGTLHAPYSGTPESFQVDETLVDDFLTEINAAYPPARLAREEVYHIHSGLLPAVEGNQPGHSVKLLRESIVYDHFTKDGLSGLISVIGVKYTTARRTAEEVVDLVFKKLGLKISPCQTKDTPLYGGQIHQFSDFVDQAVSHRHHALDPQVVERLVHHYGSEYTQILGYLDEDPNLGQTIIDNRTTIKAEIVHAVRREMAQTLGDVVLRRTSLGAASPPDVECLSTCAEIMAGELGWDQAQREKEIEDVWATYHLGSLDRLLEEKEI
jgi:glycerol-3-phosphate dehydrogenase